MSDIKISDTCMVRWRGYASDQEVFAAIVTRVHSDNSIDAWLFPEMGSGGVPFPLGRLQAINPHDETARRGWFRA